MVFGTLSDLWNAVYNSWSIFKGIGFRHLSSNRAITL